MDVPAPPFLDYEEKVSATAQRRQYGLTNRGNLPDTQDWLALAVRLLRYSADLAARDDSCGWVWHCGIFVGFRNLGSKLWHGETVNICTYILARA